MSTYIETYEIAGRTYGIEDYEDGRPMSEHFFGDDYKKGKSRRYKLWVNGGGFGEEKTIERARAVLHAYARKRTAAEIQKQKEELKTLEAEFKKLGDDPFRLSRFAVDE